MRARILIASSLAAALAWLGPAPAAQAAKVYINDVRADALRHQTLKGVHVTIDAEGNVRIDAPHYNIEVVGGADPEGGPEGGEVGDVESGIWWLVTDDSGSSGHEVDVYVGGVKVKTIRSGEPQVILDLGQFLRPGENEISFTARAKSPGGGALVFYIGSASNQGGRLNMDAPQIEYKRRASDGGDDLKNFTLKVE